MDRQEHKAPGGIAGVGIDLVTVAEIRELDERTDGAFTARSFTVNEREAAERSAEPYEYYAGRYAV